ncbi:hypothetical protein [Sphingobium yanoikuyae]|uniref:hypothetical protein n=1 Tax=Sphingobium yanoikuyae TaxID=13690 RepID=UPI00242F5821|nr:hypothetical protein [Sphingobium yanoikuyae]
MFTPAQLHQIARNERARRKAAWTAAGQDSSGRAREDDALWSNVEQITGLAAGDPLCQQRQPQWWSEPQRIIMARSAWQTACKADQRLDHASAQDLATIRGLFHLYRWLRPISWSPYAEKAT